MDIKSILKRLLAKVGILDTAKKCIYCFNNVAHLMREVIYRTSNPMVKFQQFLSPASEKKRRAINELRREGIVVLDSYLSDEYLQELKKDFDTFVSSVESEGLGPMKLTPYGNNLHPQTIYPEQGHDATSLITMSNNPFKHSSGFLGLALDQFILDVISGYMGKHFVLQQATASRYYPNEKTDFGSWQWHHDAWGRKINVMILFTDVTEKDQYMNYMKRSHKIYHSLARTSFNDRFTEEEVQQRCGRPAFQCIGSAGTVFIFDANGFHRGNRSLGAIRDSLINQYTAGRYLWSFDIPREYINQLNDNQVSFLMKNPNINLI